LSARFLIVQHLSVNSPGSRRAVVEVFDSAPLAVVLKHVAARFLFAVLACLDCYAMPFAISNYMDASHVQTHVFACLAELVFCLLRGYRARWRHPFFKRRRVCARRYIKLTLVLVPACPKLLHFVFVAVLREQVYPLLFGHDIARITRICGS